MLYKYCQWKDVKKILVDSTLFFNTVDRFNDPFDSYPEIQGEDVDRDTKRYVSMLMHNKAYTDSRGVTCFSKDCGSIPMWSHYACNHEGACFEFDLSVESKKFCDMLGIKDNIDVGEVKYKQYYDKCKLNLKSIKYDFLFEKAESWQYEKEVRCVWESNEVKIPKVAKFRKSYLKKIFLGTNSKLDDLLYVYSWVKRSNADIKISVMTISDNDYLLIPKNLTKDKLERLTENLVTIRKLLCDVKYGNLAIEQLMLIPNGILYRYCTSIFTEKLKLDVAGGIFKALKFLFRWLEACIQKELDCDDGFVEVWENTIMNVEVEKFENSGGIDFLEESRL